MRPSAWRTALPIVLLVGLAYWLVTRQQEGFQTTPDFASLADIRTLVGRIDVLIAILRAAATPDTSAIDGATAERDTYQGKVNSNLDPSDLPYTEYQATLQNVEDLIVEATAARGIASTTQLQQLLAVAQQYLALLQSSATRNTSAITQTEEGIAELNTILAGGTNTKTATAVQDEIAAFQSLIQGIQTAPPAAPPPASTPEATFLGVLVRSSLAKLYEASLQISSPAADDKIYAAEGAGVVVWNYGDAAPTSTTEGRYAFISTPLSIETSAIGDMKSLLTNQYSQFGVTIIDLIFQANAGQFIDTTGAPIFGSAVGTTPTAAASASAASAIAEAPAAQSAAEPAKDNTLLYIGIGVGTVVVFGGIAYAVLSKKS